MLNKKSTLVLFLIAVCSFFSANVAVYGQETNQEPLGIAYQVKITAEGEEILDGMIIAQTATVYTLTAEPYDRNMFGVVNLSPNIEFTFGNTDDTLPVTSDGTATVLVSGENGSIAVGDLITSSSKRGIGMKATQSGFTLGIAEEAFEGTSAETTGLIHVRFNKQFTFAEDAPDSQTIAKRLRDIVSLSAIAALDEPKEMLKYVIAGLILILAVVISFISMARTSQKGIEALGRNPLARSSIILSIFVNIFIDAAIIGAGVVGAYLLVTF
jgi:hypothetical protein